MAQAVLDMEKEEAQKKVLKILYRKGTATKREIEESFRRSTDSAGRSVNRLLTNTLKSLVKNGNLKERKRDFKWVTGRQA